MATQGKIGLYDSAAEDWTAYKRLERYFLANDVTTAEKQRAILLSESGPSIYSLIRSLVAPEKPTDKSFQQLVKLVKDHLTPLPSAIMQRFKFNS